MGRREDEQKALDIVAGRATGKKQAAPAKPKMSGFAMLSIWLWIAAIIVIGGVMYYIYAMK